MAITKSLGSRATPGAYTQQALNIVGDANYVTGGYVLLPSDFQFTVLRGIKSAFFTTIAAAAFEVAIVKTFNSDGVTLASIAVALVVGTTGAQLASGASAAGVGIEIVAEGN
jgi:hypothetical protein